MLVRKPRSMVKKRWKTLVQLEDIIPKNVVRHSRGRAINVPDRYRCDHPGLGYGGTRCKKVAVGRYEIPREYKPEVNRGSYKPHVLPRPTARLCPQHKFVVEAGINELSADFTAHQAKCEICAHPRRDVIEELWCNYVITTPIAIAELNTSLHIFTKHVEYFNLLDRRTSKTARKTALAVAMERGLAAGDHTVSTGLKAAQMLGQLVGDAERHEHVISTQHLDLTRMDAAQIAQLVAQLQDQLSMLPAQLPALQANTTGVTMDLPATAVREKVPVASDDEDDE